MNDVTCLDVRYHADFGQYFVYLPAGRSAADGEPFFYATVLTPSESKLWQRGEKEELVKRLRERGVSLPGACGLREGGFRKLVRELKDKFFPKKGGHDGPSGH